jgi:hypothetical protein
MSVTKTCNGDVGRRMKNIIMTLIFLAWCGITLADDPGIRDTVILGTVFVDLGQPYVDVPVYAVTDENVGFYNMPITWSIEADGIGPSEVYYYNPLTHWDEVFDSVLVNEHYMRMIGWEDGIFALNTGGMRWRCWEIRFTIDSLAPPQYVGIDTTYDSINGSILFGLESGIETLVPVVIPGAIYYGITTDGFNDNRILPDNLALLRNYPNPFNASTTIEFTLPEESEIELSVYNILGQKIAVLFDGHKPAGGHSVTWSARDLPSGVYFARLEGGRHSENIKMILLK